MPNTPVLDRFHKLIDDLPRLYIKARNAQVQFAREVGRRLVEEEQDGAARARRGAGLIRRVSKVMTQRYGAGFSESNLLKMRRFFLLNPYQSISTDMDWSDYVELLPIKDEKTRKRLEARILKEDLSSIEIRQLVQKIRRMPQPKSSSKLPPLKRPADLKLHTFAKSTLSYKLPDGYVLIDCGFVVSWPVRKEDLLSFVQPKSIDSWKTKRNTDHNMILVKEKSVKDVVVTDKPSYTYEVTIDRVIDGDTLLVVIEVGFGIKVHDKLRLRGIDTPELGTPEGDRAKKFVQGLLPVGTTIVIKSHKSRTDSHGRFVADVLYKAGVEAPQEILQDPVYLNQQLIDEGYAVRMAE